MLDWDGSLITALSEPGARVDVRVVLGSIWTANTLNSVTFGEDNSLISITPISESIDPVTREVSIGQMNIEIMREAYTGFAGSSGIVVGNHIKNMNVDIQIGVRLNEAYVSVADDIDIYETVWSGRVDEIEPGYNSVMLSCVTINEITGSRSFVPFLGDESYPGMINNHPAEVIKSILLEQVGISAGNIDSDAFAFDASAKHSHLAATGGGQLLGGGKLHYLKKNSTFRADVYYWKMYVALIAAGSSGTVLAFNYNNSNSGIQTDMTLTEGVDWTDLGIGNEYNTMVGLALKINTDGVSMTADNPVLRDGYWTIELTAVPGYGGGTYRTNTITMSSSNSAHVDINPTYENNPIVDYIDLLDLEGVTIEIAADESKILIVLANGSDTNDGDGYIALKSARSTLSTDGYLICESGRVDDADYDDYNPLTSTTTIALNSTDNTAECSSVSCNARLRSGARCTPWTVAGVTKEEDFLEYHLSSPMYNEYDTQDIIDELSRILIGTVYKNTDNKWTLRYYDNTENAKATITKNNISEFEQVSTYLDAINRVNVTINFIDVVPAGVATSDGTTQKSFNIEFEEYSKIITVEDTSAQSDLGDIVSALNVTFDHASGNVARLYGSGLAVLELDETDDTIFISRGLGSSNQGGRNFGFTGAQGYDSDGGNQSADRKASTARKAYLLIDDEIIECDTLYAYTNSTESTYVRNKESSKDYYIFDALLLSGTISERGYNGTVATYHGKNANVYDITPAIRYAEYLLERFAYGLKKVRFKTNLQFGALEIGDLIYLNHDIYLDYGRSGIDATDCKWEITSKEMVITGECCIIFEAVACTHGVT